MNHKVNETNLGEKLMKAVHMDNTTRVLGENFMFCVYNTEKKRYQTQQGLHGVPRLGILNNSDWSGENCLGLSSFL